jgi:Pentapeptide repeats (8 copies)
MSRRLREMRLSRARAARAETSAALDPPATAPDPPVAPLGPSTPALGPPATAVHPAAPPPELIAKEAHDLDAIRKSVEDAASVSAGLWLSYLFVLFYIGIAAGAVTHTDLLLENPVKLPFLGVDLPLIAFFVLAPILFIVSHAYTLVHFVMLGAKAGCFNEELKNQLPGAPETWDRLRRQLPSNVFVQFLAGPGDIREGKLGLILMAIAWISLVIGPVLLLLLIQAQFLPYHLERVTWVHRFAVLADVILLWLLWPAALYGRSKPMWRLEGRGRGWQRVLALTGRYIVGLTACLIPVGLAFTAATFPGERMEDWIGNNQWIPPNGVVAWLGAEDQSDKPRWTSFHDLLFNGKVDGLTRRRKSLFSNTLVLPGFDALDAVKIDDLKKLDSVKHTLILRGRHLESAVFAAGADLRKVDMAGAQLQGASFFIAQLQGAQLWQARLQGASLGFAQLQGASLKGARLQGASLDRARLQGASLENAQLQGASLGFAQLQGASLKGAQLQGASLGFAQLQGASLKGAQLQGASLDSAQLPGAYFQESTLAGTDMRGAVVWRTSFELISAVAVFEDDLKERAMSKEEFAALKATIMKEVPEGEQREQAVKRIEILNPDIFGPEATLSETLEERHVDEAAYKESLADQLKSLACSEDGDALHIVRGLVVNGPIKNTGAQVPGLVEAILKPDCPVSAALTEQDKADLRKLAEEMQPSESKQ